MYYDRKIKYFDYKQSGERICGGGFVKIEVRNGICCFDIRISGLHVTDTFTKQIYLVASDKEEVLCDIYIKEGRGEKRISVPEKNMQGNMDYTQLRAIRIPIASGCELYCVVSGERREDAKVQAAEKVEVGESVSIDEKVRDDEKARTEEQIEVDENVRTDEKTEVNENVITDEEVKVEEKMKAVEKLPEDKSFEDNAVVEAEQENRQEAPVAKEPEERRMQEDKWKQLKSIYPHVQPFGDEREYLKLGPEDFVIFNSRFYKLVHNSFLLHGYYNYQHLILARIERRGVPCYYIGVPGNFYSREKQVALLFGFESFECKAEPADTGDFGYYMIKVEI